MPAPKDIDFYDNPFGYELRRHRLTLGLNQVQLAKELGYPAGHLGAFAVASLDDSPDVVYLENARAGQVIDRQEDVQEIMNTWEAIREEALPARASLDLIAKVMEQWT